MKWVVVGHAANPEVAEMMDLIRYKYDVSPKYFATYGPVASFIEAMSLPLDYPIAFADGKYIGGIDDLKDYVK